MTGTAETTPRQRPRVEGDREDQILDATVDVLADLGYDRVTMDAVATAAKASKATLYRRWLPGAGRRRHRQPAGRPDQAVV